MSDTTRSPARALRSILTTPISITRPGVSVDALLTAAALPASLATLCRDTVRRTCLWRSERLDVARELIAHFRDGLSAGRSDGELASTFGDPAVAARLIRRAAKRKRPLPWRGLVRAGQAVLAVLFLAIVAYTAAVLRFRAGEPTLALNVTAEHNASIDQTSPTAWPRYRDAVAALHQHTGRPSADPAGRWAQTLPGDPAWPELAASIDRQADALAVIRQAAAIPTLGFPLTDTHDPVILEAFGIPTRSPPATSPNPELISISSWSYVAGRRFADLLAVDARRATELRDPVRATADLRAIVRLAAHMRQTPLPINTHGSLSLLRAACIEVGRLLDVAPDLLPDANLILLAHDLAAPMPAEPPATRRACLDDALQRIYTDDGRGSGRLTTAGLDLLRSFSTGDLLGHQGTAAAQALSPAAMLAVVDRRTARALLHRFLALQAEDVATPLWLRGHLKSDAFVDSLTRTPLDRLRYFPVYTLAATVPTMHLAPDLVAMRRDATLIVLAAELHRRRAGAYPATLADLSETLLPATSIDRYDGQPLRYRLQDGRPLVYSVGVDRRDDGGRPPDAADDLTASWFGVGGEAKLSDPLNRRYLGDHILWPPR